MLKPNTAQKMTQVRDDGTLEDGVTFKCVVRLKKNEWFAEDSAGVEHKIERVVLQPGTIARGLSLYGYRIRGALWIVVPRRRTDLVAQ